MTVQQAVDASGPVATGTGAGITVFSWLATWDWGFLIGVIIGLAGVAISYANHRTSKKFQQLKNQREQAEEQRKQELHEIQMRKALEQCNAKQD